MRSSAAALDCSGNGFVAEIVDRVGVSWDSTACGFSDFTIEQSASYMASRWGASRLRGLILRGAMSGEIEASALVLVAALPLINAGLAYVKFGPMWRRANQPARPEVLEAALCAIRQHFAGDLGLLVRVMPPAEPIWQDSWTESLARAGYRLYRPVPNPERYLVDLRLSEAEQTASLGAKWRANLRKSSTQLEIAEADPVRSLPIFMELYNSMSGRKRFADHHHIDYLPRFLVSAPEAVGVRVFVASANGQPVSASLIAGRGERVFVPLSASSADALPLRAGFALRWEIIKRLRGSGCHWLDLGGDEGDPGLRHFKTGNSGASGRVVAIPGEFDFSGSPLSTAAASMLTWAQHRWRRRAQAPPARRIAFPCGRAYEIEIYRGL